MTAIRFNKERSEGENMSTASPVIVQGTTNDPSPRGRICRWLQVRRQPS